MKEVFLAGALLVSLTCTAAAQTAAAPELPRQPPEETQPPGLDVRYVLSLIHI